MRTNILHHPLLYFVVKAGTIAVFVIGLLTYVEWITGMPLLNAVFSNYTPMKLISAGLLVLSSLSLWLFLGQGTWREHVLRITGGIILLVSFLTILTYLHGNAVHHNNSKVFNFFLKENNRMAFITTLIFSFLGVIFILFANNSRKQDDIAHVLFFPAASLSYFSMISYVLGVSEIFRIEGINIAPSIAFCLFLLCLVILFLKPDTWLMRILLGPESGSIMGRRLLPWLLVLPAVIAWAKIKWEHHAYLPSEVGTVLVAVTYTLSFIFLVWWSGVYVNRIDEKRRQTHQALIESKARLNALITATSDGVYRMSPDWKQMVSMEGGNFLSSVENPVEDWLNNFIPRDTQPLVLETINRAIATKSKFELEHNVIRQDGSLGWTLSRAIPLLDKNGEIVEWMGIAHDFTERKNTQTALQQSEELFSKAFYNTPVPAIITRISDNIMTHVNSNFLKLFEYSSEEAIGHTTKELNLFADYGQRMRALEILTREGSLQDHEFNMITKTGKQLTLLISSVIVTIHEQKHVMTTYFDITERKQAELALQESEKNLSDLYSSMTEGISVNQIIYDAEGNAVDYVFVDANPAFEKMTGQKISEVKGMKGSERYSMQKAPYLDKWAQVVASGEPTQFETYFPPLKKYFSISAFSMGKEKFATLFWDITEIKLAEKALLESTEQLRLLFENSLDAILYTNSDGTVHSMNPEAEKILGRSKEEMLHLMKKDVIDLNDPRYIAAREERQKTGRFKGELNFLKKDGTPFPVDLTSTTFKDSSGQEKSGFIFRDITERKRAEAVLAFQAQLLSEVNDAVFSSDSNFRLTYWNPTAEKMFGWTKEEALGHNSGELLKPITDIHTMEESRANLKTEGIWIGEVQFMRKNGTYFFGEVNSKTLKDAEGKYAGQIVIARDITERKRAQAEIIAAKEKAEESDRLKSAFLANMSHELRTPLNSIIGFSELMMDPDFDSDQKSKYSQIINTSGNNLLAIISDIMDISKIEAGQVQIKKQLFSVNKLMTELQEEYSLKAIQKGIAFILAPSNPVKEIFIESDQTRIRQIVVNLVGNAIKFTEKGFIELGWRVTGNAVEFHVKDTGIGIPADYQTQIFERFHQVESSDSRKYGGTGLGLAISKSLTELLGGTIWMESKQGEGSTFYFTVPIRL